MKTQISRCLLISAALLAIPAAVQAQPDAHYVPGIEGIECATLPPPGFYLRDYNVFYIAQQANNGAGHNVAPAGFEGEVFATVPRIIYISDIKVLGGYWGGDVVLPFIYSYYRAGYNGPSGSTTGMGDFYGETTLSWHPGKFDIGSAVGFWAPTGNSSGPPQTQPGLGYWTPELTLGVTYHIDEARTWAISALNRYEFNTEYRDTSVTPGQAWTLEWALSKKIIKPVDVGVVGYYQQRTTASGDSPLAEAFFPYSRVAAVGPEVEWFFAPWKLFVQARYNYEFMAENRAQGHTVALVLTKAF